MKYLQLITNKHCLAITALGLLALLCVMADSDITSSEIIIKLIGLGLIWLQARLYKKWDHEGKVEPIKQLFNDKDYTDETHGDPEEMHRED